VDTLTAIRRWLLAILVFGLIGTGVELVLLKHYDTPVQFVPLVAITVALAVIVWHTRKYDLPSLRALRATMMLFLLSGVAGVGFHFKGATEFQRDIDPSQSFWDITRKVMRAESPPVLAPGLLMQLGLVGLLYTYRHPALAASEFRAHSVSEGAMK
jgi:multisubunit Na+/H+ antiporter MnhB subunit